MIAHFFPNTCAGIFSFYQLLLITSKILYTPFPWGRSIFHIRLVLFIQDRTQRWRRLVHDFHLGLVNPSARIQQLHARRNLGFLTLTGCCRWGCGRGFPVKVGRLSRSWSWCWGPQRGGWDPILIVRSLNGDFRLVLGCVVWPWWGSLVWRRRSVTYRFLEEGNWGGGCPHVLRHLMLRWWHYVVCHLRHLRLSGWLPCWFFHASTLDWGDRGQRWGQNWSRGCRIRPSARIWNFWPLIC